MTPGGSFNDLVPATVVIEHLQGAPPGTPTAITNIRFRADDLDTQDQVSPVLVPPLIRTSLAASIAPSSSAQAATVLDSSFFTAGLYCIVDPGNDYQEIVLLTEVLDVAHLTAIFMKQHMQGAIVMAVNAATSKTFRANVKTTPNKSIGKFRIQRQSALPDGVYDQWRQPNAYAEGVSVPFYSDGTNKYNRVPVIAQAFSIPPIVKPSVGVSGLVEIQWLISPEARGLDFPSTIYRILWDEA